MKIAGIIAEYNPFHSGHAYHILQTSKMYDAQAVICIMSGHFTQRGQPALYDKWSRACAAVSCGADIVLELPFAYATQSAEGFAKGAVSILDQLNCISMLSFGTESASLDELRLVSETLAEEPAPLAALIKEYLSTGISYPAARSRALQTFLPHVSPAFYDSPNNILAIEYMKALFRQNSRIVPVQITRKGSGYHDTAATGCFSSATALRKQIMENGLEAVSDGDIPAQARMRLPSTPVFPDSIFPYALFRLRQMSVQEIASICDVSEGLEYRILHAARTAGSVREFFELTKSKRYTQTRLSRILLYSFMGMDRRKMELASRSSLYARVLCVKKERTGLLSEIIQNSNIPIITKASEFPDKNPLFDLDIQATDLYALLQQKIAPARRDFTQRFPIV